MIQKLLNAYYASKDRFERIGIHYNILKEKRKDKAILLIAGHYSRDPGAISNGTTEHQEAREIVLEAARTLSSYTVAVCPFNYALNEKIKWANTYPKDSILLSVHLNSSARIASGTETWYKTGDSIQRAKAKDIQGVLVKYLKLKDRGVRGDRINRHGGLGILRRTKAESYLVELGFISNFDDLMRVRSQGVIALVEAARKVYYG